MRGVPQRSALPTFEHAAVPRLCTGGEGGMSQGHGFPGHCFYLPKLPVVQIGMFINLLI